MIHDLADALQVSLLPLFFLKPTFVCSVPARPNDLSPRHQAGEPFGHWSTNNQGAQRWREQNDQFPTFAVKSGRRDGDGDGDGHGKLLNTLLQSLKLADFGLAVAVREPLFTVCGTPTYVAPEILAETGYGVKVTT